MTELTTAVKKVTYPRLKGLRAEHGLSMAKMAKIIGISEGSYLAREKKQREFQISEMKVIADYFKETMEEIFFS